MNKLIFALSLFVCCTAISSGFRLVKEMGHTSLIGPSKPDGESSSDNSADSEGGEPTTVHLVTASASLPEADDEVSTEQSTAATKQPAKTDESGELSIDVPKESQESLSTATVPDTADPKEVSSDNTNILEKQNEEMKSSSSSEIDDAASDVLHELRNVPSNKDHPGTGMKKQERAKNTVVSPKTQPSVQDGDDSAHSSHHHTRIDSLKDHLEKGMILTRKEKSKNKKDESSNRLSSKVSENLEDKLHRKDESTSLGRKLDKNKGVNGIRHKQETDKSKNAARENGNDSGLKKTSPQNSGEAKKSSNWLADVSRSSIKKTSSKKKHIKNEESDTGVDAEGKGKTSNAERHTSSKDLNQQIKKIDSTSISKKNTGLDNAGPQKTTEKSRSPAFPLSSGDNEHSRSHGNRKFSKESKPKEDKNETTKKKNTGSDNAGPKKTIEKSSSNPALPSSHDDNEHSRSHGNRKLSKESKPKEDKNETTKKKNTGSDNAGPKKTIEKSSSNPAFPLSSGDNEHSRSHGNRKLSKQSKPKEDKNGTTKKKNTGSDNAGLKKTTEKSSSNPALPSSRGDNEHSRSHGNRNLGKESKLNEDKNETTKKKTKVFHEHKENKLQNKQDDAKKEQESLTELSHLNHKESEKSSHFPLLFLVSILLAIALYVMYHNRQRIIAIVVEGRSPGGHQRPNSSHYAKLEDAMPSVKKIYA